MSHTLICHHNIYGKYIGVLVVIWEELKLHASIVMSRNLVHYIACGGSRLCLKLAKHASGVGTNFLKDQCCTVSKSAMWLPHQWKLECPHGLVLSPGEPHIAAQTSTPNLEDLWISWSRSWVSDLPIVLTNGKKHFQKNALAQVCQVCHMLQRCLLSTKLKQCIICCQFSSNSWVKIVDARVEYLLKNFIPTHYPTQLLTHFPLDVPFCSIYVLCWARLEIWRFPRPCPGRS